ncbi:ribonuclease H-like domain-containing protein [Tanacetum coccineum]
MDNTRPRTSSFSRTPHRPQRPKKIVKSIWVKKGSTVGSQAVLPQTVKESAMIKSNQTWRPKEAYLDSVNRDNGSYTLKQFEYGNPEEDLKDYAIIDSGCSGSMTGDKDKLSDFKEFKGGYVAFGNDSKGGRISGKGTIKTSCLDFEKVSYVEELKFNLLSVSQICDKKHNVLFTDKECLILSPKFKFVDEDLVILRAPRKNDVYSLDLKNIIPSGGITCLVAKATKDEAVLWHRNWARESKEKGPDWMFDLDLLTPSMNYIPVRKENYADSKEQGITCEMLRILNDQHSLFINHSAYASKMKNLLPKAHNDYQGMLFEEKRENTPIAKGKEHVDSTVQSNLLLVKDFEDSYAKRNSRMSSMGENSLFFWAFKSSTQMVCLIVLTASIPDICLLFVCVARISSHLQRFLTTCCQKALKLFRIVTMLDNHDRRSTSGGCQYLGRRLVSWQCKKQTIVLSPLTEAEYVAAQLKLLCSLATIDADPTLCDENGVDCFPKQVNWDVLRDIGTNVLRALHGNNLEQTLLLCSCRSSTNQKLILIDILTVDARQISKWAARSAIDLKALQLKVLLKSQICPLLFLLILKSAAHSQKCCSFLTTEASVQRNCLPFHDTVNTQGTAELQRTLTSQGNG